MASLDLMCVNYQQMHACVCMCVYRHVMASLDLMVKSLSSIRNDPRLRVVSGQLAGWFKNRKETLAPTEVVDMLHSFAMLRYNPGGDEQGYKVCACVCVMCRFFCGLHLVRVSWVRAMKP